MPKHCLNCAHYHPTDKTQEIGVCFEEGDKPIVQRYRFRFETWTCWEENVCMVNEPILNVSRKQATAIEKEIDRVNAAEIMRAYWAVVRQVCNKQIDQKVA